MHGVEVGEVVATVDLNGLQQPHNHPEPDHHQVVTKQGHTNEEASAKNCVREFSHFNHSYRDGGGEWEGAYKDPDNIMYESKLYRD